MRAFGLEPTPGSSCRGKGLHADTLCASRGPVPVHGRDRFNDGRVGSGVSKFSLQDICPCLEVIGRLNLPIKGKEGQSVAKSRKTREAEEEEEANVR